MFSCLHSKVWVTLPCLLRTTVQHLNGPHTLIPLPRAQNNFSCFQTVPPWTFRGQRRHSSIRPGWLWLISPPNNQFVFTLFFSSVLRVSFFPSISWPLSIHCLAVLLMWRVWRKSRSADGFDTLPHESNKAITIWPWGTTHSCVCLSGFLTYATLYFI